MNKKEIEEQVIKMAKETGKIGIKCKDFCGYPHVAAVGWEATNGTDASTREEQIEEMAIGLEEEFVLCGTLSSCGTKRCSRCFSKYLYEQGYRKFPDGATVLLVGKYNQALDEKTIEYFIKHNEQIRKETAREILQTLYNYPHEWHEMKIKELAKQFGVEVEK